MKKVKYCISMVLVCTLFFATASFAAARASAQIDYYNINAIAIWYIENLECTISTTIPEPDLKRVVNSIY